VVLRLPIQTLLDKKMNPEDKLQEVLAYAGHRSVCDALGVNWRQGPCDCGWEQIEAKLIESKRAKEKEMLNDEFELDPEAKMTLERWQQVSAKMTEDMTDHIKGLISALETTLKFGNGRIWLGLNANVLLAYAIYGVDRFDNTPDFSETGWIEAKGRRGAVEHTRRKQSPRHHEKCGDSMGDAWGCHPDCKIRIAEGGGNYPKGETRRDRKTAFKIQG